MKISPFLLIIFSFVTLRCSNPCEKSNFFASKQRKQIDLEFILSSIKSGSKAIVTSEQQKNALEIINTYISQEEQSGKPDTIRINTLKEQCTAIKGYPLSNAIIEPKKIPNELNTRKDLETLMVATNTSAPSFFGNIANIASFILYILRNAED